MERTEFTEHGEKDQAMCGSRSDVSSSGKVQGGNRDNASATVLSSPWM
jgi:hypothetical protein